MIKCALISYSIPNNLDEEDLTKQLFGEVKKVLKNTGITGMVYEEEEIPNNMIDNTPSFVIASSSDDKGNLSCGNCGQSIGVRKEIKSIIESSRYCRYCGKKLDYKEILL